MLKSISKLFGVVALVVTAGLGAHGVASAIVPFDGGDNDCRLNEKNCHLYHFKLDGKPHKIEFVTYGDLCRLSGPRAQFTVQLKNSANIWLDAAVTKSFTIRFDGGNYRDMGPMKMYSCPNDPALWAFLNNENKCWYLTEFRTRGDECNVR